MNYCTLDEAWGNNILKDSRKKKKTKRLYTSQIPDYIYDKSYEEGGHDTHCNPKVKKNYTVKNKNRYDKSRGPKDIYRPKRSSRVDNLDIRYDEANQEYRRYKKESKRNTKNNMLPDEIVEQENNMPFLSQSNTEILPYLDADNIEADFTEDEENSNSFSVLQENDLIQEKIQQRRAIQAQVLEEQRKIVEQQNNSKSSQKRPPTPSNFGSPSFSPSYDQAPGYDNFVPAPAPIEGFDNYYQNLQLEPFENHELDLQNNQPTAEINRINKINDVSVRPSVSFTEENEDSNNENVVDKLIKKKIKKRNTKPPPESEVDTSDSEGDTDSETEEELKYVGENKGDIEYRLNNLNRNMNLIIKKMNSSNIFDGDTEENIHDIILFVLFGIFIIFVLDTIYRFGKNSASH